MKFTGFQQLLYRKFLIERRWRVDEIAQLLGVDRSTMYQWVDGVRTCPYDIVPHLYLVTQDIDFLTFGLQGTGYTLAKLPGVEAEVGRVESETLDVARVVGTLVEVVQRVTKDGQVDHRDRQEIEAAARDVQRETEEVVVAAQGQGRGLRVAK